MMMSVLFSILACFASAAASERSTLFGGGTSTGLRVTVGSTFDTGNVGVTPQTQAGRRQLDTASKLSTTFITPAYFTLYEVFMLAGIYVRYATVCEVIQPATMTTNGSTVCEFEMFLEEWDAVCAFGMAGVCYGNATTNVTTSSNDVVSCGVTECAAAGGAVCPVYAVQELFQVYAQYNYTMAQEESNSSLTHQDLVAVYTYDSVNVSLAGLGIFTAQFNGIFFHHCNNNTSE